MLPITPPSLPVLIYNSGPGFSPLEACLFLPLQRAGYVMFNRVSNQRLRIQRKINFRNFLDKRG
jgi:hypothetical protein